MDEPTQAEIRVLEQRLDTLERESQDRRAELRRLAAELPQATSRRALVTSMVRSIAEAPDKVTVAKRVSLKVARTPADLVRRARKS